MAIWPFTEKQRPDRKPEEAPKQPEISYLSSGLSVAIIQWKDFVAAEQAMRHPVIYRALNKLAESVGQVHWFAEPDPEARPSEQRGTAKVIADLNSLLRSPNGDMTASMLRYWMTLNFAIYGRVAIKVGYSAVDKDKPNGLYPLETRYVNTKTNNRGIVQGYTYGQGEDAEKYPSRATFEPGTGNGFIGQIWKPGLRGYQNKQDVNSPLESIGLPAQVIRSLLLRAITSAEGHPNCRYLITCSKTLTIPQKEALKAYIEDHGTEGFESGRIPILQNAADVEIHKLDNDLSDIHSKMPTDDMSRLIYGAFGIPMALAGIGAADAAKYASNYTESRAAFWQDTIIPAYVSPLFQGLTSMLCPEGVRITADFESIPALLGGRIDTMKSLNDVSFLTETEKRELVGYGPKATEPENATQ